MDESWRRDGLQSGTGLPVELRSISLEWRSRQARRARLARSSCLRSEIMAAWRGPRTGPSPSHRCPGLPQLWKKSFPQCLPARNNFWKQASHKCGRSTAEHSPCAAFGAGARLSTGVDSRGESIWPDLSHIDWPNVERAGQVPLAWPETSRQVLPQPAEMGHDPKPLTTPNWGAVRRPQVWTNANAPYASRLISLPCTNSNPWSDSHGPAMVSRLPGGVQAT